MKLTRSTILKGLGIILGIFFGFITLGIVGLVAVMKFAEVQDRRTLDAALYDFRLPANYKLIDKQFEDSFCFDVCAYYSLTYESADGRPLSKVAVENEFRMIGYEHEYSFEKQYKNKEVRASVFEEQGSKLTVHFSL